MTLLSLADLKADPSRREALANQHCQIWSSEHGAYWRDNSCGYTAELATAGLYLFVEAWAVTSHCGPEKQIFYRFEDHAPSIRPELRDRLEAHLQMPLDSLIKRLGDFGYEIKAKPNINPEWQNAGPERNVHFITGPQ